MQSSVEGTEVEKPIQQRIIDIETMLKQLDDEYVQELIPKQLALQNADRKSVV